MAMANKIPIRRTRRDVFKQTQSDKKNELDYLFRFTIHVKWNMNGVIKNYYLKYKTAHLCFTGPTCYFIRSGVFLFYYYFPHNAITKVYFKYRCNLYFNFILIKIQIMMIFLHFIVVNWNDCFLLSSGL